MDRSQCIRPAQHRRFSGDCFDATDRPIAVTVTVTVVGDGGGGRIIISGGGRRRRRVRAVPISISIH